MRIGQGSGGAAPFPGKVSVWVAGSWACIIRGGDEEQRSLQIAYKEGLPQDEKGHGGREWTERKAWTKMKVSQGRAARGRS